MKRYLLAGSLLALALTGCGDDTPEEVAATATAPDEPMATSGPAAAEEDDPVEITAVDYAFEDVPESVAPGTELTLSNASTSEVHEMVIFHVDDDQTMPLDEIVRMAAEESDGPPPEWLQFAGFDVAMPGESGFAPEGPVVLDEPGRYLLLCLIPTGADPAAYEEAMASGASEAPQADGGPPHVAQGMAAELVVE